MPHDASPDPSAVEPPPSGHVPLTHVLRGGRIECVHYGSYALVKDGLLVEHAGDPAHRTYFRSTSKPFQAMVCVTSGAADRFDFDGAMLAVAAGSHNAEPEHLAPARAMLAAAGLREDDLQCGGHWSINKRVGREQAVEVGPTQKPLPAVWSNCSGKHASMLASAVALGAPVGTYLDPAHPVQVEIVRVIAACAGVAAKDIGLGCDGCGAPVHEVSLEAMARALFRFGYAQALPKDLRPAAERVGEAMTRHPHLVGGTRRFDTDLMETAAMTILSKAGAEGVHGLAVPRLKLGLAIKVQDGNDRGYQQVVLEILRRHGALTKAEADVLAQRYGQTIRNFAGTEVGCLSVMI